MSQIAIVNQTTVVTDADGQSITDALNLLLPTFCNDWLLTSCRAVYVGKGKTTPIKLKVFLLDTSNIQGALGYHDITSDVPYGKCFAKTVLQYGGVILYSSNYALPTFAQTVSHEVFELLFDPYCNGWWDNGKDATCYATEVGDPVESNIVKVNTTRGNTVVPVGMSDWILPAWSDPQRKTGPFNHNNTLKAPFTLDKYGYAIVLKASQITQVFGEHVTEEQRLKHSQKGRIVRRTGLNNV
jgi:hypothetical protein